VRRFSMGMASLGFLLLGGRNARIPPAALDIDPSRP